MKIVEKILGVVAGVGAVLSALFYVLFQQKKDENKLIQEQYNNMKADAESKDKIIDALQESKKEGDESRRENAEKKNKIHSDNAVDSFNTISDILCN